MRNRFYGITARIILVALTTLVFWDGAHADTPSPFEVIGVPVMKAGLMGTLVGPGPGDSGQILVFAPKHPEKQIEVVGRPAASESYLWMYTIGPDKKLYACTFPDAKIVSYDAATGEHKAILPEQYRNHESLTFASVQRGVNGQIYISAATMVPNEAGELVKKAAMLVPEGDGAELLRYNWPMKYAEGGFSYPPQSTRSIERTDVGTFV